MRLDEINNYLKNCLWMDFEICEMSFIKIEVAGRIDRSINDFSISIEFNQPYLVYGLLTWGLDNSKEFISLAKPSEFIEFNKRYRIEQGKYLFRINMEDFDEGIYIAASDVKCVIYKENPFD
jgi:hypothetical protein